MPIAAHVVQCVCWSPPGTEDANAKLVHCVVVSMVKYLSNSGMVILNGNGKRCPSIMHGLVHVDALLGQ